MTTPTRSESGSAPTAPLPAKKAKKKGFLRRWLTRFAVMGVGVVAAGLVLELLVTTVYGKQVRFPRHVVEAPWGIRYNHPQTSYWHYSPDVEVQFKINAQGMRANVDYAYAKPAGVKRVICIGDSFTMGYEVADEACFARQLERRLTDSGLRCEVLNAGVSGFGNAEALVYLERELLKYDPDLIILSFFINDLDDNVRSNLFRIEDGELVNGDANYVPMGKLGNFMNTNPVMGFLSERSNAFAMLKEVATNILKRNIADQHLKNLEAAEEGGEESAPAPTTAADEGTAYQMQLAGKILDRLYDVCRSHDLPLIIQSIPVIKADDRLVDVFPVDQFETKRPGLHFIPCTEFLAPHVGSELLYHEHSHLHWTPFAHDLSAQRLAEVARPLLQ